MSKCDVDGLVSLSQQDGRFTNNFGCSLRVKRSGVKQDDDDAIGFVIGNTQNELLSTLLECLVFIEDIHLTNFISKYCLKFSNY